MEVIIIIIIFCYIASESIEICIHTVYQIFEVTQFILIYINTCYE